MVILTHSFFIMELCELTPIQLKIEKLINGKARTSSFLVVDYTTLCDGIISRTGDTLRQAGPQWRPLPESRLHLQVLNIQKSEF